MKKSLGILLFLGIFLIIQFGSFASAQISLGQPESTYNLGDYFSVDVSLNSASGSNDFLIMNIVCGEKTAEIYRNPINLASGEQRDINVAASLTNNLIGDLRGNCNVQARYDGNTASSQTFEISDSLLVETTVNSNKFSPGDSIIIQGQITKKSGTEIEGFVEVFIEDLGISTSTILNGNTFTINLSLPDKAKAGEHVITVKVYEKDSSGNISNQGSTTQSINVNQILTELKIVSDKQTILPDEDFIYSINAYDQSGDVMQKEISLTLYEPGDFSYLKKIISSGVEEKITLDLKQNPGYWKIEAVADELITRKLFYLEEIKKIQTSLVNDTLLVTNIGNTRYRGPIQISIGSAVEIRQLDLEAGEVQKFRLSAPTGTYLVSVSSGEEETPLGNALLTGNVVGIKDLKDAGLETINKPTFWVLGIIIILLLIIYVKMKMTRSRPTQPKMSMSIQNKQPQSSGVQPVQDMSVKKPVSMASIMDRPVETQTQEKPKANSQDVFSPSQGRKENATLLALCLNANLASPYTSSDVNAALSSAKSAGAKVYVDGDFRLILFAESLTKSASNDLVAVKVSKRIEEMFLERNKKFKEKINFGIGVNNGEIISETKDGEFKFTTTGNLISKAKRIAQFLDGQTLISETVKRNLMNDVKTEIVADRDAFKITKITDREKQSSFMRDFIKKS